MRGQGKRKGGEERVCARVNSEVGKGGLKVEDGVADEVLVAQEDEVAEYGGV